MDRRDFLALSAAAALTSPVLGHPARAPGAKFKLGLVTYNVAKDWDLKTLLSNCREAGIAAIECRTTHGHGIEPSLSAENRKSVRKQFEDSGVHFWGCGSTCEFHSLDAATVTKQIDECKRFLQLVADLGGKGVKVRPNGVPKGSTIEATCERIGKALQQCGTAAKDFHLEIWVEVHGGVTQEPKNMRAIMDACGHASVGLTWNSNPTDLKNNTITEALDLLKKDIRSCHINTLENDATGKYPYRQLFAALTTLG
ncbi:MAG: sugar phosphate isomerase/epimerase family protein [Gemmataceae bacterium]